MSHGHMQRKLVRRIAAITVSTVVVGMTSVASAQTLQLDVNNRGNDTADLTQDGFTSFTLGASSTTASGTDLGGTDIDLTLTVVDSDPAPDDTDAAMDDRLRGNPVDSGAFTFGDLYRDFIFVGGSAGLTGGVNIEVSDLMPNTQYAVTIYSFDTASGPTDPTASPIRSADYTANGAPLLVTAFVASADDATGSLLTNDQFAFTGIATADASGDLFISGRASSEQVPGVFINGLVFEQVIPEPTSLGLLGMGGLLALRRKRITVAN